MKGITAFACISDVDETLIAESLSLFENPYISPLKAYRREQRRAFFQSPLWAAMICAVVSLSVLSAVIMAGNGIFTHSASTDAPETEITAEETESETKRQASADWNPPHWPSNDPTEDPNPQRPTVPEVTVDANGPLSPGYGVPDIDIPESPVPDVSFPSNPRPGFP